MAKKDRGAEWKAPEFDEVEFMKKEMRAAKTTILVVLWTVPAALATYGLTVAGAAVVAFFAGIGMMFLLKWILPLLKVDISEYKRKEWIGHGLTFFFSWLAFWILLLNPPFADLTNPVILGVTGPASTWTGCGGTLGNTGGSPLINVSASDNVAVSQVTVTVGNGSPVSLNHTSGTLWQGVVNVGTPPKTGVVTVVDTSGHAVSCAVTFS